MRFPTPFGRVNIPVVPVKRDFERLIDGITYTIILKRNWKLERKVYLFTISPGILKFKVNFAGDVVEYIDVYERKNGKWVYGKLPINEEQQVEITRNFELAFPELKNSLD
ncbi:hypothetical protein HYX00_03530 [Candidatus Woesearchaeota archaeon]|nr:hypothetical protein [Candidatus Woesearchaeota archaeon]